jgi:hypothetical protein
LRQGCLSLPCCKVVWSEEIALLHVLEIPAELSCFSMSANATLLSRVIALPSALQISSSGFFS